MIARLWRKLKRRLQRNKPKEKSDKWHGIYSRQLTWWVEYVVELKHISTLTAAQYIAIKEIDELIRAYSRALKKNDYDSIAEIEIKLQIEAYEFFSRFFPYDQRKHDKPESGG
ncbi:MAG: hypothetical protein JW709_02080 [Sedimentisphaerales bacterium]|nr:hypothetical protein [Sedimentisphaerales bacterium]